MLPENKSKGILKDYQSDADHLVEIYCNPHLPPKNTELYHYKTAGNLQEYLNIKRYKPNEIDLIMGLIRLKSKSSLDPYASPIFIQKTTGESDEQLLQLLRDLKPFGNDPFYLDEIDLKFIRIPEAFENAEKWANQNTYLSSERIWKPRMKGRLGTFLRILIKKRIIYPPGDGRPNDKVQLEQIDTYFTGRYQVDLLGDLIKPKFAKKYYSKFKDMDEMLTIKGWPDQIGIEFP